MSALVRVFPLAWLPARVISHFIPEDCSKERVPKTQEAAVVTRIEQTSSHFNLFALKPQRAHPTH